MLRDDWHRVEALPAPGGLFRAGVPLTSDGRRLGSAKAAVPFCEELRAERVAGAANQGRRRNRTPRGSYADKETERP